MKIRVLFNEYGKASYSIYRRKNQQVRYFWRAEKRVKGKLRHKYIGYDLSDKSKLFKIAELFDLSDTEYYKYYN